MLSDTKQLEPYQRELDYNVLILGIIICMTISVLLLYGAAIGGPYMELMESLQLIRPESIASCPRG